MNFGRFDINSGEIRNSFGEHVLELYLRDGVVGGIDSETHAGDMDQLKIVKCYVWKVSVAHHTRESIWLRLVQDGDERCICQVGD